MLSLHKCLVAVVDSLGSAPPPVFDKKKVVIDRLYEAIKSAVNADSPTENEYAIAVGCQNTVDFTEVDDLGKAGNVDDLGKAGNDDDDKVRLIPVCKYYCPSNKPQSNGDVVVLSLSKTVLSAKGPQIHYTFDVDISLSKLCVEYVTVRVGGGEADISEFSIIGEPMEISSNPLSPKFYGGLSRLVEPGQEHHAEFEVQAWAPESHATFVDAIKNIGEYLKQMLSDEKPLTIRFAAAIYQDADGVDKTEAKLAEKYGMVLKAAFLAKMKEMGVEFYTV